MNSEERIVDNSEERIVVDSGELASPHLFTAPIFLRWNFTVSGGGLWDRAGRGD